jgi:RNA polymerase sigma-70 factor (ECF subfamily)
VDAAPLGSDRTAEVVDDDRLVQRARAGDTAAFGELVTRHRQVAIRVAAVVAPTAELDDVLQEACVKAWHALPRFRQGAPFRPWWCRIVANEAKNRTRAARRRETLHLRSATSTPERDDRTPEASVLARDEADALVRALDRLSDDDRLVIAYRWLLELPLAEIADAIGVPLGTVKSRLSRAMTKLRTELAADGRTG